MNLEIENISSTYQHIWRSIYEVIHDYHFKAVKFFPSKILNQCKNNPNKPQNIPNEVRSDFRNMALENGLYAQVVMILRRGLDDKNKKIRQKYITSKENQQEQNIGLILIMIG